MWDRLTPTVCPLHTSHSDREKERALLCFAHYKEDANDAGHSVHGWVKLEDLLGALGDNELNVLDHYLENNPENNPSTEWTAERCRLRAEIGEPHEEEDERGGGAG